MTNFRTIPVKEVKSWTEIPNNGGLQLYNPSFRHLDIEQIEGKTRDYIHAYRIAYFCREVATIYLFP